MVSVAAGRFVGSITLRMFKLLVPEVALLIAMMSTVPDGAEKDIVPPIAAGIRAVETVAPYDIRPNGDSQKGVSTVFISAASGDEHSGGHERNLPHIFPGLAYLFSQTKPNVGPGDLLDHGQFTAALS